MRKTSSILIAIVLALLCIGIVMLASVSSVRGSATFNDPYYFIKRQLIWLGLAVVVAFVLARFDYHWLQRLALPLGIVSITTLVLVLIPGIGAKIGGSYRWFRLGPFSVQPSEFAKLSTLIVLSAYMTRVGRKASRFVEGLVIPLLILGTVLGLMILEPDFGTTLLTGVVGMLVLFVGGTRIGYLAVTSVVGMGGFSLAVMRDPVRMGRILAFIMPEKYPATAYHLAQSKLAFIRGGAFGVGLGESMQKQFYLPEAHTDFILAIIGEELGFVATGLVLVLFIGLVICGMIISFRAPDPFGRLLGFGITMMLAIQASINIGVVTGCLPTKGLALPFISYGGSSLLVSVAAVAILINIAGHIANGQDDHTRVIRDRTHRL